MDHVGAVSAQEDDQGALAPRDVCKGPGHPRSDIGEGEVGCLGAGIHCVWEVCGGCGHSFGWMELSGWAVGRMLTEEDL